MATSTIKKSAQTEYEYVNISRTYSGDGVKTYIEKNEDVERTGYKLLGVAGYATNTIAVPIIAARRASDTKMYIVLKSESVIPTTQSIICNMTLIYEKVN